MLASASPLAQHRASVYFRTQQLSVALHCIHHHTCPLRLSSPTSDRTVCRHARSIHPRFALLLLDVAKTEDSRPHDRNTLQFGALQWEMVRGSETAAQRPAGSRLLLAAFCCLLIANCIA